MGQRLKHLRGKKTGKSAAQCHSGEADNGGGAEWGSWVQLRS